MSQENVAHRPLELILARNLLTNISIPAFLVDNRGGLVFYNEAAESLLGMPFQQARNMDPEEWRARFGPFDSARERIPLRGRADDDRAARGPTGPPTALHRQRRRRGTAHRGQRVSARQGRGNHGRDRNLLADRGTLVGRECGPVTMSREAAGLSA